MERILVSFEDGKLNALIYPQAVEGGQALRGHGVFHTDFWVVRDEVGISLPDIS
jgi:hypothetical protein